MGNVTTVGIDLAKNVFSLHGVDANGAVVLRKTVSRARLRSRWALAVRVRRGYHRACIAVAAKNARVVWAMLNQHAST